MLKGSKKIKFKQPIIMPLCKCGCKKRIVWKDRYRLNKLPIYIQGHNNHSIYYNKKRSLKLKLKYKLGILSNPCIGKHPHNFNNYSSFEPYTIEFNNKLKEQIRKRDSYRCQECFRHQDELRTKNNKKRKLCIHHIDYNKKNNNENNLISLCLSCHTQTNYKRNDWINYFKNKIEGGI